jgi:hypothetical protein
LLRARARQDHGDGENSAEDCFAHVLHQNKKKGERRELGKTGREALDALSNTRARKRRARDRHLFFSEVFRALEAAVTTTCGRRDDHQLQTVPRSDVHVDADRHVYAQFMPHWFCVPASIEPASVVMPPSVPPSVLASEVPPLSTPASIGTGVVEQQT